MTMGQAAVQHRVIGSYRDKRDARKAIEALELRGFEGGRISLEGRNARVPATKAATQEADAGVFTRVTARTLSAGLIGVIGGATLGLVAALIAGLGHPDIWMPLIAGVAMGGTIGAFIGAGMSVSMNAEPWGKTYYHQDESVLVAVQPASEEDATRAMDVMREHEAVAVTRD